MKKIEYEPGMKIGNCLYINELPAQKGHRYALFSCSNCKNSFTARISHVKATLISTCGCLTVRHFHGKSTTRLYHIWEAVIQRCTNLKHPKYTNYGGRGITVDSEWLLFTNFETWALSNGYKDDLTLDRVNVNSNYTSSNCRWATKATQQANRRKQSSTYKYIGIEKQKNGKFSVRICHIGIRTTIGVYDTEYDAALARDIYILKHNLPHTLNILSRSLCPPSPSIE